MIVTALLSAVLLFLPFVQIAYAVTYEHVVGGELPNPRIQPFVEDGQLREIIYFTRSTGATSGIRYRTTNIYVTATNANGTVAALQIPANFPSPPPGEAWLYQVTIHRSDLLAVGADPASLNNLSRIAIGADLQIHNASTGVVLRTINNGPTSVVYPQIDQLGPDFGFGQHNLDEMKSRFADSLLDVFPPGGGPECSIDSGTVLTRAQVSGRWSYNRWASVTHWVYIPATCTDAQGNSYECGDWYSYQVCEIVETVTGDYYELLEMEISLPQPSIVKAGQGTTVTVTTRYRNNNPAAWNGSSYTTGITSVQVNGPDTEDWPYYFIHGPRITENMILLSTNVYYENYRPATYSTGCNGGFFNVGYNIPVVEQVWAIPFARFDDIQGWTRHQTMPNDIDNRTVFGGLNRWYFGFDVPDNTSLLMRFLATGGSTGNLTTCGSRIIDIFGSPYDNIWVRTVDPRNPFPGGVPINWVGKEHYITDLIDWYEEPERAYQQKLANWSTQGVMARIWNYFRENILKGLARLQGRDIGFD
jgi:hypothetical protein